MTPEPNKTVLQAQDLHFSYPSNQLFSGLSINIAPGITLIQGGDGRGKSTLLRLLAGVLPAQAGQLQINGTGLQGQPSAYRSQVYWAEPRSEAHDQLTAHDYFEVQRRAYADFDDAILADAVAGFDLAPHLHKQLFMLSTGSKRKVWLAAALASNAAVTPLDEPFAALDTASINYLLTWLAANARTTDRAWVMADYVAPDGLALSQVIDLGD
jgi:ABC-type transport system involved in cytochrome c biogenesis ATPase subunit